MSRSRIRIKNKTLKKFIKDADIITSFLKKQKLLESIKNPLRISTYVNNPRLLTYVNNPGRILTYVNKDDIIIDQSIKHYLDNNTTIKNLPNKSFPKNSDRHAFIGSVKQERINAFPKLFLEFLEENPIKVKPYKTSKYFELIDGRHRFIRFLTLNIQLIPAIVVE